MTRPTIGNTEAVSQAGHTVSQYLYQAIDLIDRRLGYGYAEGHPELVAACITAQTMDFSCCALMAALYDIGDAIRWAAPE